MTVTLVADNLGTVFQSAESASTFLGAQVLDNPVIAWVAPGPSPPPLPPAPPPLPPRAPLLSPPPPAVEGVGTKHNDQSVFIWAASSAAGAVLLFVCAFASGYWLRARNAPVRVDFAATSAAATSAAAKPAEGRGSVFDGDHERGDTSLDGTNAEQANPRGSNARHLTRWGDDTHGGRTRERLERARKHNHDRVRTESRASTFASETSSYGSASLDFPPSPHARYKPPSLDFPPDRRQHAGGGAANLHDHRFKRASLDFPPDQSRATRQGRQPAGGVAANLLDYPPSPPSSPPSRPAMLRRRSSSRSMVGIDVGELDPMNQLLRRGSSVLLALDPTYTISKV